MAESLMESAQDAAEVELSRRERDPMECLIASLGLQLGELSPDIRAAIEAMASEILSLRKTREDLIEALEQSELLADRDVLCPVFNRRAFERELSKSIAMARRHGTPLCLVYVDLDRFKLVNDQFGHARGDEILKQVAQLLVDNFRESDRIGRLGGDEFAITLPHAEYEGAVAKAERVTALIDALKIGSDDQNESTQIRIGASCGVIAWEAGMDAQTLISAADEAMFRVKAKRRNPR